MSVDPSASKMESDARAVASRLDPALATRLRHALPRLREWMFRYTESTAGQAVPVASVSIPNLSRCYSKELPESTRVVITDQICYPPLEQLGLGEFKALTALPWDGITYNDIYYVRRDVADPAVHFHEIVLVVQYRRLGVDRFLWAYGVGRSRRVIDERLKWRGAEVDVLVSIWSLAGTRRRTVCKSVLLKVGVPYGR